jgi:SAM-dependent methyltransferase
MDEATKTWKLLTDCEKQWFNGTGIDIGCGADPIRPNVRRFDMDHGDANRITDFVSDTFDYVFSCHCLEHMHDPVSALAGWWKLVKPGGRLIFIVPDEDLYEQGVFPSRFNEDHKATFTLSKRISWSPRSYNVLDLASGLNGGILLKLELQDIGYDRGRYYHFSGHYHPLVSRCLRACRFFRIEYPGLIRLNNRIATVDQSILDQSMCQIFCAIQKDTNADGT